MEGAVVYLRVADGQPVLPDGAKEALVSLLDLAEQHFRAGAVIIALEKTRADSSAPAAYPFQSIQLYPNSQSHLLFALLR